MLKNNKRMDNQREFNHTECDTINVTYITMHRTWKGIRIRIVNK